MRTGTVAALLLAALWPAAGGAYPGGTPSYQTDAAPYCAGCHSSRRANPRACSVYNPRLARFWGPTREELDALPLARYIMYEMRKVAE